MTKKKNEDLKSKKKVSEFFSNEKNIKIIRDNQEYSEKISRYVAENSRVSNETLTRPFGPNSNDGLWPHQK